METKSSLNWLKNGDNNKLFHIVANGRKARDFISSLNIDGSITNFKSLFSKQPCKVAWLET